MATGAGRQLAAQHSHSLENWYAHIPGITVLAPATVADAYGMLRTALTSPDPVIIFEHVGLYNISADLEELVPTDIARAALRRNGTDATIIAYGGCVPKALDAAEQLAQAGIDCDVIDLRVLRPLDDATILESVAQDPPRGGGRRGLAHRQPGRGDQRPHRRAGLLRTRRPDRSGLHRRGADPLRQTPRGGGPAAARQDRGRGAGIVRADRWPGAQRPGTEAGDRVHDARPGADMDEGTPRRVAGSSRATPSPAGRSSRWSKPPRPQWKSSAGTTAWSTNCWCRSVQTVAVGTPLATLLEPGEKPGATRRPRAVTAAPAPTNAEAAPAGRAHARRPPPSGIGSGCPRWPGGPPPSLGVDLKTVTGTGPQGADHPARRRTCRRDRPSRGTQAGTRTPEPAAAGRPDVRRREGPRTRVQPCVRRSPRR